MKGAFKSVLFEGPLYPSTPLVRGSDRRRRREGIMTTPATTAAASAVVVVTRHPALVEYLRKQRMISAGDRGRPSSRRADT